jgi:hypothetical protein
MHKGYKCLHPPTNRVYISRDVVFDEHVFPFATTISSSPPPTIEHVLLPTLQPSTIPLPTEQHTDMPISSPMHDGSNPTSMSSGDVFRSQEPATGPVPDMPPCSDPVSDALQSPAPLHGDTAAPTSSPSTDDTVPSTHPVQPEPEQDQRPRTCLRNNISKIKDFGHDIIRYDPKKRGFLAQVTHPDTVESVPISYAEALRSPHWKRAMQDEYEALIRNGTCQLTPPPLGGNVVDCKWIFKVKRHADGSVECYKARLVAKGFHQRHGLDYDETFNPVIKPTIVHLVLSIAVSKGWCIRQADVKNAFLNGALQETVFMKQPPGFVTSTQPQHVYRLQKALYGLKQPPRAWHSTLTSKLCSLNFRQCKTDTSLFIYKTKHLTMYVLIYVDDLIVVSSSNVATGCLLQQLDADFSIKDLGNLHYFLGIEVHQSASGLILSQQKYITDLLRKTHMTDCRPVATLMSNTDKVSRHNGTPLSASEATVFRSTVGALQYLMMTRPDIGFSVNRVCQFMQQPTDVHWTAVKRILRYLKYTIDDGLCISRSTSCQLSAFSDSDWAGCSDNRRSTGGFLIFFGPNLISWSSRKQATISRSSTEFEYKALANATAELVWLQSLLREMEFPTTAHVPILWCDNLGSTYLSANPRFHGRTKHIEVYFHFVRERVANKALQI